MTSFSICIPNFNYAGYIGETIGSALAQPEATQVLVCDNASTDGSVDVVRAIADPRLRLRVNRWNVGFAANLDRACEGADADRMILLSSDDLLEAGALATYARVAEALGSGASATVFNSGAHVIDGAGRRTGKVGFDARIWHGARRDAALEAAAGAPVWRIDAALLLRNAMLSMRTPFQFASTCYPRSLYEAVEGYAAVRFFSPDKFFAWKLLGVAAEAIHVDAPLVSYRVHDQNQNAVQKAQRALRHMADQYAATFDTPAELLERAGIDRAALERAFIEQDVALRGMKFVAEGNRSEARRGLAFGKAAYPRLARSNARVQALRALLAAGPAGTGLARIAMRRALARWRDTPAAP
ncbi:glycosyltransferase family 2 protein [Sphingomonas baiyangensis]|uniref:Glycosyltransferase family 2 protein n=1 Tax=Sphingomonas baiyangensis TaxID=2572576 RepID=A0A4U1L2Q4_9SPHN|nr:glycosyltransferase family 2 protein [Sphingomonas baiyangensis]TKD50315.1 glycosyltransferase family 2 protein [Sphingomonas baiyangensis]